MNLINKRWSLFGILAVLLALFHLYTSGIQLFPTMQQRGVHLGGVLALVFLSIPFRKSKTKDLSQRGKLNWTIDIFLALCSIYLGYYLYSNYIELSMISSATSPMMFIIGGASILLVLEATRRILGWTLPIVSILILLYVLFGDRLPLLFAHSGVSIDEVAASIGLSSSGIMGTTLGISATYIVMFVLFGALLEKSGAGQFFIDLALSLFGRFRGGPAKVATVSSALFGSISGSPAANAATTGVITIPLMIKNGYKPHYAGAVEAVASTGGMLMPPVLGSVSFLIAEALQLPYVEVLWAALIPALLYFLSIFIMVDLNAAKENHPKGNHTEIKSLIEVIKQRGHLVLPVLLLVYLLVIQQAPPIKAAFWAIISIPITSFLKKETRMSIRKIIDALQEGIRTTLVVAVACACAGIIIGAINVTGIGIRLSGILIETAGGNLFILLVLTMFASIVLGMGLPPVAAYIILAVLAVPALTTLGVDPLAAHFFVFYFGTLSCITPPVAIASFITSGIAGATPMKTALKSVQLALVAFIIPFFFVYGPQLLLIGAASEIIVTSISATIGVFALAVALEGFFSQKVHMISRILLTFSALLLIHVGWFTDLIGLGVIIAVFIWEKLQTRLLLKEDLHV
ncbi:TRAP transporter permease [Niallia sp. Krafla_26]|uniref:TRAP transporter permease n=1 Tax=Niallia sp. Krafla_26 TaxID=3064703 RepID=UPI003D162F1A